MIIDDEEHARNGIKSLINWQDYEISVIVEGCDGAEALELLETNHIDILITDIRMPEVDGFKLIKKVNEQYSHVKCIIMSGYNDFNYARQAIKIGANDYLLKPSSKQEILDSVLKLVHQIQVENKQHTHLNQLNKGFRESLPLLKENLLRNLVLSDDNSHEQLLNKLKISGLYFSNPFFSLVKIQIDNFYSHLNFYETYDIEMLKYGLKNISEETLSKVGSCGTFEEQDNIIVILNNAQKFDVSHLLHFVNELKENVEQYLQLSISVGISGLDKPINQLKTAYLQATNALDSKFFEGPGKVIDYEKELKNAESLESTYPLELEKLILQSVLSREESNIKKNIKFFQLFLNKERSLKDKVVKFTFNLYFSLYHLCIERNLDLHEIFKQDLDYINLKLTRSNIEDIYEELLNTALLISKQLDKKKSTHKLLESALEFIRQNYDKNISRDSVASEVYITPGYLSLLFKQHLNMSFLDFLHKIRIEKACLLLNDPSKRVADIALEVGYNDEKYFFQVFKKYIGMTPKQFRNTSPN